MTEVTLQLEHCAWGEKQLIFKRPVVFKLQVNPFSGEAILEQDNLDIYVLAVSYDDAVHQAEREIGYIWDEYILCQRSVDALSRMIAVHLSALVASFNGAE